MNSELEKIDSFLQAEGFKYESYMAMSMDVTGNPLVTNTTVEAYCFDKISNSFYPQGNYHSADSLLLKENLYFIEFKSVDKKIKGLLTSGSQRKKFAELEFSGLKKDLCLKLSESYITLKNILEDPLGVIATYKYYFIIVVDYVSAPVTASSGVLAALSAGSSLLNQKQQGFDVSFNKYRKAVNGDSAIYDDVMIWNNINFSAKISALV